MNNDIRPLEKDDVELKSSLKEIVPQATNKPIFKYHKRDFTPIFCHHIKNNPLIPLSNIKQEFKDETMQT